MPCRSFPITRAIKGHVDPMVTPFTVLVAFRTDIWTHPRRDPAPTPPASPKMVLETNMKGGKHVDEAVERVREVLRLDRGGKREVDPGDDEYEERKQNLKCFGSRLGLRGGAARGECLESAETLVGDGESGGEDQGEFVGSDADKTLAEDESADLGAGWLRRADDVMGKVGGASDQKVDVDVERA